jgi:hypothetical protein
MNPSPCFFLRFWSGLGLLCCLGAASGSPLDAGFDVGPRADDDIVALAQQADGKILVGGDFTTIHGSTRSGVARLNPDGSIDAGFQIGSGAAGTVGS